MERKTASVTNAPVSQRSSSTTGPAKKSQSSSKNTVSSPKCSTRQPGNEPLVIDTSTSSQQDATTQPSPLMNKYKDLRRVRSTSKGINITYRIFSVI